MQKGQIISIEQTSEEHIGVIHAVKIQIKRIDTMFKGECGRCLEGLNKISHIAKYMEYCFIFMLKRTNVKCLKETPVFVKGCGRGRVAWWTPRQFLARVGPAESST